jgi:hypothetical protein
MKEKERRGGNKGRQRCVTSCTRFAILKARAQKRVVREKGKGGEDTEERERERAEGEMMAAVVARRVRLAKRKERKRMTWYHARRGACAPHLRTAAV